VLSLLTGQIAHGSKLTTVVITATAIVEGGGSSYPYRCTRATCSRPRRLVRKNLEVTPTRTVVVVGSTAASVAAGDSSAVADGICGHVENFQK
jgi:hypothetical protein